MSSDNLPPSSLPPSQLAEIEAQAVQIAGAAGDMLMARFRTPLQVDWKGKREGIDPVTEADREIESFVRRELEQRFPDHAFVGEEGEGGGAEPRLHTWVLDPLDGTVNFMNGLPLFACSLALLEAGAPVAGAIFIPWPGQLHGLILSARSGGGARAGTEQLLLPADTLSPATAAVIPDGAFRISRGKSARPVERRSVGSIAYELAATALGSYRCVLFTSPRTWDVAAGILIVREAGGHVLMPDSGGNWRHFRAFAARKTAEQENAWPGQDDLRQRLRPILAGPALELERAAREIILAPSLLARLVGATRRVLGPRRPRH